MNPVPDLTGNPVVSRGEWLKARRELLAKEKAFTRLEDEMASARRALPWMRIETDYRFEGPSGPLGLAELFEGRSRLFVKHFMLGPDQGWQCPGCSLEVDHVDGLLEHLWNNDVTYAAVARAPIQEIEALRARMGWRFPFVSSFGSEFNYDFGVSFLSADIAAGEAIYNFAPKTGLLEDLSGNSVFYKNALGEIFHTYSSYGRGAEQFLGIYGYLDVLPGGRNELGPNHSLMDWAKPRNLYEAKNPPADRSSGPP
jgi:predicted dithiol-disulfide oxidoreductase (DUF899 family)